MQEGVLFENILYNISKVTNGQSEKLFQFFDLDKEEYESILPLTKLQRDLYIDTLVNDKDDFKNLYNFGVCLEYNGALEIAVLKKSLTRLAEQEPVLRTVLVKKDLVVYQAQKKHADPPFEFYDLYNNPGNNKAHDLFIEEKIREPYDNLIGSLLYKIMLVRVDIDKYYLVLGAHQLAHDARSVQIFLGRIVNACRQMAPDSESQLNAPHFTKYVFDNNDTFDKKETLDFWKQQLENNSSIFPSLHIQEPGPAYATSNYIIEGERFFQISQLCEGCGITMSAYFKILLGLLINYHFSPDEHFVFFENIHGRSRPGANALGVFFHPVPVVFSAGFLNNKDLTFTDCIRYLQQYNDSITPFRLISMGALNAIHKHEGARIIFNYIDHSAVRIVNGEMMSMVETLGNKNEIQILIERKSSSVQLKLFYHNSFFCDYSFFNRLAHISEQLVSNAETRISELNYIIKEENDIVRSFFSTESSFLHNQTVIGLFDKQVALNGDRVAVQHKQTAWTYNELGEKAGQLAAYLQNAWQIKKGDYVGVWMDRSHYTLLSILAILKAGAVYLPIETELPDDRVEFIVSDAAPKVIIIDSSMIDRSGVYEDRMLVIDWQLNELVTDGENAFPVLDGVDLAYIIYTSGTTGRPKGVMIRHHGMLNHIMAKINDLQLNDQSIISQNANAGFDISIWQFLAGLLTGGKVIVYANELVNDIRGFMGQINNDAITVLEVVPSYLSLILEQAKGSNKFQSIQHLLVTGEKVNLKLVQSFFRNFSQIKLVNAYGPTEASDDITHYIMDKAPVFIAVPIGKPIHNIRIYIVDTYGRLCPVGIRGELYVSGVCVGQGYLNNPLLTNESFIDDPFADMPGGKLYKTGDIGSWMPDGNIVFYGRKDAQVKVRGHRIELGDIEQALSGMDGVIDVIVDCRKDVRDESYLVAYIKGDRELTAYDIRMYLENRLPKYMFPAAFIQIKEWPLTTQGKVNRKALQLLPEKLLETEFSDPATEMEAKVASLWRELLGKDKIGVTSNFFELGGHSLKAMQLIFRIHEAFRLQLDLKMIFAHPTVRELAKVIEERCGIDSEPDLNAMQEVII